MNLHNFSNNPLFNNEVIIESQYVKAINYYTPLGCDFDFNSDDIKLDYKYHILDNTNDNRKHIIIFEFKILERDKSQKDECILNMILEGMYKINESVEDGENFTIIKQFVSLNLMTNFLRIAINNITSLTFNKDFFLPPINISELHKNNNISSPKKKKKIVKKK